jgi:hypothetical protein
LTKDQKTVEYFTDDACCFIAVPPGTRQKRKSENRMVRELKDSSYGIFAPRRVIVAKPGKIVMRTSIGPARRGTDFPETPEQAREMILSLSHGMLHLLHQVGGSAQFDRALRLAGFTK